MKCKYCAEEMAGRGNFCPICGRDNSIDPEELVISEAAQLADEVQAQLRDQGEAVVIVPKAEAEENGEPAAEEALNGATQLKKAKRVAILSGCVAALAVLALVLFFGIRAGWDVGSWFDWLKPRANTVLYKDSYTVSDKKAYRKKDDVVATLNGEKLTNGQLQVYYWTEVYDFFSNYSYYLAYLGLDLSKPLDEQYLDPENTMLQYLMGKVNEKMTWQQYFLEGAIQMWQSNQAFAQLAKENGYTLGAEDQKKLDDMPAQMKADAKKAGFDSVDAYVQDSMGPGCTLADYMAYMETYYLGYSYFAELYNAIDPTEEELDAYFAANEDAFKSAGITKGMGYTVDVRHILISIETIAKGDGTDAQHEDAEKKEYTEAQWEACRAAAQAILDQWLAGEKTEDSFAALVKEYSEDAKENVEAGGLYTYVQKGEMEGEFDTWCFDEARAAGDYGLVKTSYGYHIIYFVDSEDLWLTHARTDYLQAESQKIVNATLDQHPIEVTYKKIVLGEVALT